MSTPAPAAEDAATSNDQMLVSAAGLGKCFRIYRKPSHRLVEWLTGRRVRRHTPFWALRDLDLSVARGECLGIIGRNGSGKSTLLKLLTGTLTPTTGRFQVRGRLLSIIELGTGFNVELTGRENIRVTAGLLGFDEAYIQSRFDQILAFADIGEFIDRPIKLYSSGMLARVAFAMYAFLEPEILVVDEVLSVGDAAFQRKCYRCMEQMIQSRERAVVLVTHDLNAVTRFCTRAIWLDGGQVRMTGPSIEVVEEYLRQTLGGRGDVGVAEADAPVADDTAPADAASQHGRARALDVRAIPTDGLLPRSEAAVLYPAHGVELLGLWVENQAGERVNTVGVDEPFTINYAIRFGARQEAPVFGTRVATIRGELLIGSNTELFRVPTGTYEPGDIEIVRWPILPGLNAGRYFISCGVSEPGVDQKYLLREVDAYEIAVTGPVRAAGLLNLTGAPVLAAPSRRSGAPAIGTAALTSSGAER